MINTIIDNQDGTITIQVDFIDEGVDLQGQTSVKGGQVQAQSYLPVFEADLRRNFADKFPLPEVPAAEEEMI